MLTAQNTDVEGVLQEHYSFSTFFITEMTREGAPMKASKNQICSHNDSLKITVGLNIYI